MTNASTALVGRMGDRPWLTDGGLETELVFHDGRDLPCFAAFPLLSSPEGRERLARYWGGYLDAAADLDLGFVLDTPTWRASAGWGEEMGMSPAEIDAVNAEAVDFARLLRAARGEQARRILVNGVLGPAGDGYTVNARMTVAGARDYHHGQLSAFAGAGADMATILTMTTADEAAGAALAARDAGIPFVVSFTVETDGHLPDGTGLERAIGKVDAESDGYPLWFMVNCAHPSHFRRVLNGGWVSRIGGIRANASCLSHAELDASETLDEGDPDALGEDYADLSRALPQLRVVGGCCGTDLRHVAAVGRACTRSLH
jgi:homocysteine S-methyltransferase